MWRDARLSDRCLVPLLRVSQCGVCRMGPPSAATTVVDPRCRVVGIRGLRVADASVIPHVISGNTNAPCIMVGEKVADMIKEDWA